MLKNLNNFWQKKIITFKVQSLDFLLFLPFHSWFEQFRQIFAEIDSIFCSFRQIRQTSDQIRQVSKVFRRLGPNQFFQRLPILKQLEIDVGNFDKNGINYFVIIIFASSFWVNLIDFSTKIPRQIFDEFHSELKIAVSCKPQLLVILKKEIECGCGSVGRAVASFTRGP